MRPVLSREQMRSFDRYAIETCHVPGLVLMENAGRGAAEVVSGLFPQRSARLLVVCGVGNNGGDGFVVARHLLSRGSRVHVVLFGRSEKVTGDARVNHDAYIDLGGSFAEVGDDLARLEKAVLDADAVVDALFGTGLDRVVRSPYADAIAVINRAPCRRVALDLPSGLDADTGAALGVAVTAHETVTFGHLKAGLLTSQGARYAGRVHVVGLGVPETIVSHTGQVGHLLDGPTVASYFAPRETNAFKGQAGNVAVIAGSPGHIGAALLSAEACLRAGAGLSTLVTWPEIAGALEQRVLEVMTARLDRRDLKGSLDKELSGRRVVAIGPGFGLDADARTAVDHVVLNWGGTKIVDADALTHFAGRAEALARAAGRLVLTPHPGELARLAGKTTEQVEKDRFAAARELASVTRAVVVLKGARTIIASAEGVFVNPTGNPALATAGAGDVLTGTIAAFACTMTPVRAASAGVFLQGAAADRWRRAHDDADRGMVASDVTAALPATIAALIKGDLDAGGDVVFAR